MAVVNPEAGNEGKPLNLPLLGEGELSSVQHMQGPSRGNRSHSFEVAHAKPDELEIAGGGLGAIKVTNQPEIYAKYTLCLKLFFTLGILCCFIWVAVMIGALYNEITHFKSTNVILFIVKFLSHLILIGLCCYGMKKMINSFFKGFRIQEQIPQKLSFLRKINCVNKIMVHWDKLIAKRIDLRSKVMVSNEDKLRLQTVAQKMKIKNEEKMRFYSEQNKIIVKFYNAWIIRECGQLLKDLPIDILANILQGLVDNNSSLLITAIAKLASDAYVIFSIWYKKYGFLTSKRNDSKCFCCNISKHFPIDNRPYYTHFGTFIAWYCRLKWAAGIVQIYAALASLTAEEYDGLYSFKVVLYCYNFVFGIFTIIRAKQDYFLFRYQFCFFWTKEAMTSVENNLFVNKLNGYFSNICYFYKITFDKKNDKFNKIDDKHLQPSKKIHHKCDCFTCTMCCDLCCVVVLLLVFILWGTACFGFVGQEDEYSLSVVDELGCEVGVMCVNIHGGTLCIHIG